MARVCYIGDEITAAGYRLAGADVRVPGPGEAADVLQRALVEGVDLLLVSAGCAAQVDADELDAALLGERPLVAIVPDLYDRYPAPDVAGEVRRALGIES